MRNQQKWQSMELQGPVPLPEKKWQITWQKLSESTLSANQSKDSSNWSSTQSRKSSQFSVRILKLSIGVIGVGFQCQLSCSVVSNSLRPHGLQPTRLLCPWDSPGKNTGAGCHFFLQGIFPTQGSNPDLLHCRQTL